MPDFSTLPRLVLYLVQVMCLVITGLLAVILAILYFARQSPQGLALQPGEGATAILMAVLMLVALVLAYAARRELRRMP